MNDSDPRVSKMRSTRMRCKPDNIAVHWKSRHTQLHIESVALGSGVIKLGYSGGRTATIRGLLACRDALHGRAHLRSPSFEYELQNFTDLWRAYTSYRVSLSLHGRLLHLQSSAFRQSALNSHDLSGRLKLVSPRSVTGGKAFLSLTTN